MTHKKKTRRQLICLTIKCGKQSNSKPKAYQEEEKEMIKRTRSDIRRRENGKIVFVPLHDSQYKKKTTTTPMTRSENWSAMEQFNYQNKIISHFRCHCFSYFSYLVSQSKDSWKVKLKLYCVTKDYVTFRLNSSAKCSFFHNDAIMQCLHQNEMVIHSNGYGNINKNKIKRKTKTRRKKKPFKSVRLQFDLLNYKFI